MKEAVANRDLTLDDDVGVSVVDIVRRPAMSPGQYRLGAKGETMTFALRQTVLGLIAMAATKKGVCFAEFGASAAELIAKLTHEFPEAELMPSAAEQSPELDQWVTALNDHLAGHLPRPDIPLDIRGTAFQMTVWRFLLSIPEGTVKSYSELAKAIGKPRAARAVASACGRNRIGVLIPCHRVLRGDGGLGGYRWGLERKTALLDKEQTAKNR